MINCHNIVFRLSIITILISLLSYGDAIAQYSKIKSYLADDKKLPESAKPWVFWYWMQASFSREGITADLESMQEAGIGGAYIAPIKGKTNPPLYEPVIETLTPEWWSILKFALQEADRLGIKIALLPNDGFATAGGPWITPELSMQKVVWESIQIKGGKKFNAILPLPENYEGYYKDIAIFAFPGAAKISSTAYQKPKITTSNGADASFLSSSENKKNFASAEPCWIQYEFEKPFLCRSIKIRVNNYNFQSHRLIIAVSDDGINFKTLTRLVPPRTGWLDWDAPVTHSIPETKARFYRFIYDPEGTEPGAEDIDAAKWKQSLKIAGIELTSEPKIHQFEGKNGQVWRVGPASNSNQLPDSLCIPLDKIIDISAYADANGKLNWQVPPGNWTILRIGHTSTGHKNETAGAGKGLEVDKFNADAVKLQFDKWFGEAYRQAGPELASRVLKVFHVDSWESGSQNWSPVFREEFKKRRGYDLTSYLPAMAGIPVQSAAVSEGFLYDVRQTIAELLNDEFFETLKDLAEAKGAVFTAETTAPVMTGDGLRHFGTVDVPMGEFWHNSPSHDKPNDMLDAISGAHIYGKNIIQAEAFTTVRMKWDEHPGNLKTLQDRNYALGVNKLVYHVFVHNPWMDRKPGMTLDGVGLYFQRDQTWWKPGKAWVTYAQRSQALLQEGKPVTDIAVFSGEEIPSRAILPDRLTSTLPGLFGNAILEKEKKRLANTGLPTQRIVGVTTSANMAQPENWVNPLRGYAYDSFNKDVLLQAQVSGDRVVFPNGGSYALIVLPQRHQMNPNSNYMSLQVAEKLLELVKNGAKLLISEKPVLSPGLNVNPNAENKLHQIADQIWEGSFIEIREQNQALLMKKLGKGTIIKSPYQVSSFSPLGLTKDLIVTDKSGKHAEDIAWNHRKTTDTDIYFVANQQDTARSVDLSFRILDKLPEIYDAITGKTFSARNYRFEENRTIIPLTLAANASIFIIFNQQTKKQPSNNQSNDLELKEVLRLNDEWELQFDPSFGGPQEPVILKKLTDWSLNADSAIKYYSGTAKYTQSFQWKSSNKKAVWLDLGEVANIAEIKLNGISCGVAWTPPYRVDISKALKKGENLLEIEVSNTWANRLIGDQKLPPEKRVTQTTAPFRLADEALLKAGLLGPIKLIIER